MERWLYLLRHGKSDWHSTAGDDLSRPLAARGRSDVPRVARALVADRPLPERILVSPARRTLQTASLLVQSIGLQDDRCHIEPALYAASVADLLALLHRQADDTRCLMVIAHNPGLEMLVTQLAERVDPPVDGKFFPTAACACLRSSVAWSALGERSAALVALLRPRHL